MTLTIHRLGIEEEREGRKISSPGGKESRKASRRKEMQLNLEGTVRVRQEEKEKISGRGNSRCSEECVRN